MAVRGDFSDRQQLILKWKNGAILATVNREPSIENREGELLKG